MLSVLPRETEVIRASQSRMLDKEEKFEKKRKPSVTVTTSEGLLRRPRLRGDVEKVINEDTKSSTKEGDVKDEIKAQVKPSVTLDKKQGVKCSCTSY